jgi:hypothetical protein
VVTDTELVKSGGKVNRVPRKEISMDTVEYSIDLHTNSQMNLVCTPLSWLNPRTRKVTFPSLKKYF